MIFTLKVNGVTHTIDADDDTPLLYVLRDELGLNGPKFGCGLGQCGACTVLVDGRSIRSCVAGAVAFQKSEIVTLEGLSGKPGTLHSLQQAFLDEQAGQCAYCINGMIMQAADLLKQTPHPTEANVREALDHNLCRCGTHNRIVRAVLRAAKAAP